MNKLMYSTIVLSLLGVASAGPVQVSYTLNLGSGTINGNNLTNIAILEESGGSVHLDYSFSGPESGVFTLSHMVDSLPEESLIVGLDFPSTTGGDDKTHVVFFTNSDFVASSDGNLFSSVFPGIRHSDFVNNVLAAERGDAASQSFLTNFFLNQGQAAAFKAGDGSSAIEFSTGRALAPEPMSVGLVGFGLVGVVVASARRARAKK